jgi:hypothetical protein
LFHDQSQTPHQDASKGLQAPFLLFLPFSCFFPLGLLGDVTPAAAQSGGGIADPGEDG